MFALPDMIICGAGAFLLGSIFGILMAALMVVAGHDKREGE